MPLGIAYAPDNSKKQRKKKRKTKDLDQLAKPSMRGT